MNVTVDLSRHSWLTISRAITAIRTEAARRDATATDHERGHPELLGAAQLRDLADDLERFNKEA